MKKRDLIARIIIIREITLIQISAKNIMTFIIKYVSSVI